MSHLVRLLCGKTTYTISAARPPKSTAVICVEEVRWDMECNIADDVKGEAESSPEGGEDGRMDTGGVGGVEEVWSL